MSERDMADKHFRVVITSYRYPEIDSPEKFSAEVQNRHWGYWDNPCVGMFNRWNYISSKFERYGFESVDEAAEWGQGVAEEHRERIAEFKAKRSLTRRFKVSVHATNSAPVLTRVPDMCGASGVGNGPGMGAVQPAGSATEHPAPGVRHQEEAVEFSSGMRAAQQAQEETQSGKWDE